MSTLSTVLPISITAGKVMLYRFPGSGKGAHSYNKEGREFTPSPVGVPITDAADWLGAYTLCPLLLRLEDGTELSIPDAVVAMTRTKQIVTTQVVGMVGTVKEYISDGDFDINIAVGIQGVEDGKVANVYPEEGLRELRKYLEVDKPISVQSAFFDLFEINRLVLKSYSLTQGTESNYQELTISALSDNEYNVFSTDY
nr:MAG TPA: hypothetical protein [Caudoviricetes sp.]